MFDTHITRKETAYVDRHIHEHKAPTDESIRLYGEMEKKAMDRILSVTKLEINQLKATWHVMESEEGFGKTAICRFNLNGDDHRFEIKLDYFDAPKEQAIKVRDELIKQLATIITMEAVHQNSKIFSK